MAGQGRCWLPLAAKTYMAPTHYLHGINSSAAEGGHTVIMVEGRVDTVYTNGIDRELLEEWDIALASIGK